MPTYEYECLQDKTRFELWQEVGAEAPVCPDCGSPTKKVFHAPRVIFKGSGFYVTDLRAEKEKSSGGASKSTTESTPTESKPAETKTETKVESTSTPAAPSAPAAS